MISVTVFFTEIITFKYYYYTRTYFIFIFNKIKKLISEYCILLPVHVV
jgi:hypothetical protein